MVGGGLVQCGCRGEQILFLTLVWDELENLIVLSLCCIEFGVTLGTGSVDIGEGVAGVSDFLAIEIGGSRCICRSSGFQVVIEYLDFCSQANSLLWVVGSSEETICDLL